MPAARSVNDYSTPRAIRLALQSVDEDHSLSDDSVSNHDLFPEGIDKDAEEELQEDWDWVLSNYDAGTTSPQSITQELHRLQVLKSYAILDEDREEEFERLTKLASRVFQVPITLVSLVDIGRQWFMSNLGLGDTRETPRNLAFCAHAVQGKNAVFVVKDTLEDSRFCDSPLVTGAPYIRFYAGAPLLSPEGYKLGTFCIIDSKPHPDGLSPDDEANLIDFAAMAMEALVKRRQISAQQDTGNLVACTAHDLLTPLMGAELSLSLLQEDAALLSEPHRESLSSAIRSCDWLHRICQTTMNTLRDSESNGKSAKATKECPLLNLNNDNTHYLASTGEMPACTCGNQHQPAGNNNGADLWAPSPFIDMKDFVTSLNHTMESIPKRVPLVLTVDESVPKLILSDELKLFRSSLNLLSNAFSNTTSGSVKLHIRATEEHLIFECTDTGEDLQIDENDADLLFKPDKKSLGAIKNLGLYSVGYQIESLGGSYGYRPRVDEGRRGSLFWFHVPIIVPDDVSGGGSISEHSALDLMDRLDSSVVHFPVVTFPANGRTEQDARLLSAMPFKRAHTGPASLTDQRVKNRNGMLAVAAASLKKSPSAASCCGLDALAGCEDMGSYKADRSSQSPGPRRSSRLDQTDHRRVGSDDSSIMTNSRKEFTIVSPQLTVRRSQSLNNNVGVILRKPPVPSIAFVKPNNDSNNHPSHDGTSPSAEVSAMSALRMGMEKGMKVSKDSSPGTDCQNEAPSLFALPAPVERVVPESAPTQGALFQIAPAVSKQDALESAPTQGALFQIAPTVSKLGVAEPAPTQGALFQIAPTVSKLDVPESAPLFQIAPKQIPAVPMEICTKESNTNANPLGSPRQKRALVIEDTLIVRKTLTRALQKRGYEVTQAVDGLEGLNALKKNIFDISLCDFLMPNMDGLDCVQQYRQWEKENRACFKQRIVGISAHVSHKDIDKGLEIGMDDFKSKPITMKILQELDECPAMDEIREKLAKRKEAGFQPCQPEKAPPSPSKAKACLMATDRCNAETSDTAKKMTSIGWQVTIVNSGSSALEQLKSRNWGAVILDDDLPTLSGNECGEEFRIWESENRVNRQDNLFIVCTDVVLPNPETKMMPPSGFDGAVDSQMPWKQLQSMMEKHTDPSAGRRSLRSGLSIVTR